MRKVLAQHLAATVTFALPGESDSSSRTRPVPPNNTYVAPLYTISSSFSSISHPRSFSHHFRPWYSFPTPSCKINLKPSLLPTHLDEYLGAGACAGRILSTKKERRDD